MKKTVQKSIATLLLVGMLFSPKTALAGEIPKDKKADYEAVPPQFTYDDNASVKAPDDASSRFVMKDGIYVNPDANDTGKATLVITGDLMCQYRQQNAKFVSDGKDYISYEEYKEILEKAKERQAEAVGVTLPQESDPSASNPSESDPSESEFLPALPDSSVTVPPLDLGVIPQPGGTWDFRESFQYVRQILRRGDLTIGNLETMVSQSSPLGMQIRRLEDKPYLNAPASYLDAVKYAGYDLLTMANNHNVDTGLRGLYETLQNVEDWGFLHTGLFSSKKDDRYIIVEVNGIKIGIVSYASYYNDKDGNLTESGQDVLLNRYGKDKAKADIRAAKKAGAEFVIAFIHWGAENTHVTTDNQQQYARNLARAGADYIVGSHPHALQRYDIITTSDGREVPVIFSMGNFLSSMQYDINNDTIILQLNLKREESGDVAVESHRIYPCTVLHSVTMKSDTDAAPDAASAQALSYVIVPQQETYRTQIDTTTSAGRDTLKFFDESLARTMKVFSSRTALPLPYDPYDIESDEPAAPKLSPKGASNYLSWILANAAATTAARS